MLSCKDKEEVEKIFEKTLRIKDMEEKVRKSNKIESILIQLLIAIVVTLCYHFLLPKERSPYEPSIFIRNGKPTINQTKVLRVCPIISYFAKHGAYF